MKCEFECYTTHRGSHMQAYGESETRARCRTHHWDFNGEALWEGKLCPIGRIEQTVEDGIRQIKEALSDIERAKHQV